MKKIIFSILIYFLAFSNASFSQTAINGGYVSGLWEKSKSPYQIFGQITVPNNQTLTIEKGVKVEFQGHFKLTVEGRLLAIGDKLDSIVFTGKDTTKWGGIKFIDIASTNDTSKLGYCVVEKSYASSGQLPRYATTDDYGGGIYVRASKLAISNSCIRYNKAYNSGGICCGANITIVNTTIRNNESLTESGGLSLSNSTIAGCVITDNIANSIGAMRIEGNALLYNNTICNNISKDPIHGSIFIRGKPKVFSTIIFYNKPNLIAIDDQGSFPEFQFCDLENGASGFQDYYPTLTGSFRGIYKNNTEAPPLFIDMQNGNYRLGASPCINAGTPVILNGTPQYDADGKPRIFNDSEARIDIGAYEYQGVTPNRRPFCKIMDGQYFLKSQKSQLAIKYFDADTENEPDFKVSVTNSNVSVKLLGVNDSTIFTEIDPLPNWSGEFYLHVNINDNSGSNNSTSHDSIKIFVSNRFKGDINSSVTFQDTILVIGDITVQDSGSLKIQPGSFIEFQDWYKIKVLGKLNVLGTKENKVVMNCSDTITTFSNSHLNYQDGWGGIEFIGLNRTDTMFINYCSIKNTGINALKNRENGTVNILDSKNIYFNHCSFTSNFVGSTSKKNSGIYAENSKNIIIKNCDFFNGWTLEMLGVYVNSFSSDLIIDSCKFHDTSIDRSFNRNCIYLDKSNVQLRNSNFFNNLSPTIIGSYSGSLIVENCIIKDNQSDGIDQYTPGAVIRNNFFINNRVAINCRTYTKIVNNLIAYSTHKCGCSNFNGSAIDLDGAGKTLIANNTIVKNSKDSNGNTVYASYCSPTVINNIFWNNVREGFGYYNGAGLGIPSPIVKNNLIKGTDDPLNFDLNPSFQLKDSLDFSLLNISPCINKGLSDTIGLFLPPFDLLGNKRIDKYSGKLDLGAYEYSLNDVPGTPPVDPPVIPPVIPPVVPPVIPPVIDPGKPGEETSQNLDNLTVYPNPTTSTLNLSDDLNSLPYEIFTIDGKIILSGTISNSSVDVNVLPSNFYILRVLKRNKYISTKFIKL